MTLPRVSYTGKDFDTYFSEIVAEIQTNFTADANDFTESNLGTMFIDLVAFGLDTLSFYADLQAGESFMDSAVLDASVVKIARQLGYRVPGAVPASSDVTITLAAQTINVTILKGFNKFSGGTYTWEVAEDKVILAGSTTAALKLKEGRSIEERFISDGTKFQVFKLGQVPTGMQISEGSVRVVVANEEWEVVNILEYRTDKIVEVQPRTAQVVFGDGLAGQVPAVGSEIRVLYFSTHGVAGNDVGSGAIASTGPIVVGGVSVALVVTASTKPTGGSAGKTTEEIRRLAPEVYRARDAAVTARDIVALSEAFIDPSYGAVARASAISVRSASSDAVLDGLLDSMMGQVGLNDYSTQLATLSAIKGQFGGTERTDMLSGLAAIQSYTETQQTDINTALGYEPTFTAIFDKIVGENGYDINTQIGAITTIAHTYLKNAENAPTQQRLGVGSATPGETFSGTLNTGWTRIVPGAVSVRKNGTGSPGSGTQVAIDNGNGVISGVNVSGTIDYFTGQISVTEVGNVWGLGDTVDVDYQTVASAEADVYSATSAIASITGTAKVNTIAQVNLAVGSLNTLVNLLTQMLSRCRDQTIGKVEEIRAILNTLSTTYMTDFQNAIDSIGAVSVAVNLALTLLKEDIFNYVDSILSSDCRANVVQVAILTVDPNGFYVAPNSGLVHALQVYLDARKEATVSINVINGESLLVPAVITIAAYISDVLIAAQVKSEVDAVVDNMLKRRDFGSDLRLSDLYEAVGALTSVSYAHIQITGPIEYLVGGDLVVPKDKIITKGTVTTTVNPISG